MENNPVLEAIYNRRSTRSYMEKQVEREKLDQVLDAAIWAPSGSNSQTWLFTAIQNKEVLHKINDLVKEGFKEWIPDDDYPAKSRSKINSQKENYNFYYEAPSLIIASNKKSYTNAIADCVLGLENIFLAAESLGLGSCYINQLHWLSEDQGIRTYLEELGIPKDHMICGAAALGYTKKETKRLPRKEGRIKLIQ